MRKIILYSVIPVCLISFSVIGFKMFSTTKPVNESKNEYADSKKIEENKKEDSLSSDENKVEESKLNKEITVTEKEQYNLKKEDSKTQIDSNVSESSAIIKEPKQSDNKETTESSQKTVQETPKKQEIWETFGMTKDQYFNQPMYSWERVDFQNMSECLTYGDNYEPYINGEVLYNCRDVLSMSGRYLGVMFDTEKLN